MAGPAFLVIGAQKSGTTWLHQNLQAHPDVWLPPEKELHFFDERISSDLSLLDRVRGDTPEAERWRRQVRRQVRRLREDRSRWRLTPWYARYFLGSGSLDWYQALFRAAGMRTAGEVTPDYSILSRTQVETIADVLPDLRIVLLIRNPIERLWSHAQMQERLAGRSADEAVLKMLDMDRPRAYGDYLTTLDRWSAAFGPERVWLGFMEDISHHPRAVLNAVTDHLGVAPHDQYPKARRSVHKGGQETIPGAVAKALAAGLEDDISAMADRVGGHARWWDWTVSELLGGAVPDQLDYPLWESALAQRYESGVSSAWGFASGRYDQVLEAACTQG